MKFISSWYIISMCSIQLTQQHTVKLLQSYNQYNNLTQLHSGIEDKIEHVQNIHQTIVEDDSMVDTPLHSSVLQHEQVYVCEIRKFSGLREISSVLRNFFWKIYTTTSRTFPRNTVPEYSKYS